MESFGELQGMTKEVKTSSTVQLHRPLDHLTTQPALGTRYPLGTHLTFKMRSWVPGIPHSLLLSPGEQGYRIQSNIC